MPEMPDVTVYVERLAGRVVGRRLQRIKVLNPFLVRTAVPPLAAAEGRQVEGVERLAKRIVLGLEGELFLVIHLMIAGRLKWLAPGSKPPGRIALALFEFETAGTLLLTEAGTQRRASLHLLQGRDALAAMDPGGIDVTTADLAAFAARLAAENHTVKRALTLPQLFSGIGNAYSDEALHAARLSPLKLSRALTDEEFGRLYDATQSTLNMWIERLRTETGEGFPEKVTAFHDEMAVHGRFKLPCPVCGKPVQRIVYASNECNYCAACQTNGRLLADRSLSRLLRSDWPTSIDDL
jgi:formamidopyrimidine-DNA glycosylase